MACNDLNNRGVGRYREISSCVLNDVTKSTKRNEFHWNQEKLEEEMPDFIVSAAPADNLAPLGFRTSAGKLWLITSRPVYITNVTWRNNRNYVDKIT